MGPLPDGDTILTVVSGLYWMFFYCKRELLFHYLSFVGTWHSDIAFRKSKYTNEIQERS